MDIPHFVYPFIWWKSDRFHILAFMSNAAVNVWKQVLYGHMILIVLGSVLTIFNILRNWQKFSKAATPFTFPSALYEVSNFSTRPRVLHTCSTPVILGTFLNLRCCVWKMEDSREVYIIKMYGIHPMLCSKHSKHSV